MAYGESAGVMMAPVGGAAAPSAAGAPAGAGAGAVACLGTTALVFGLRPLPGCCCCCCCCWAAEGRGDRARPTADGEAVRRAGEARRGVGALFASPLPSSAPCRDAASSIAPATLFSASVPCGGVLARFEARSGGARGVGARGAASVRRRVARAWAMTREPRRRARRPPRAPPPPPSPPPMPLDASSNRLAASSPTSTAALRDERRRPAVAARGGYFADGAPMGSRSWLPTSPAPRARAARSCSRSRSRRRSSSRGTTPSPPTSIESNRSSISAGAACKPRRASR